MSLFRRPPASRRDRTLRPVRGSLAIAILGLAAVVLVALAVAWSTGGAGTSPGGGTSPRAAASPIASVVGGSAKASAPALRSGLGLGAAERKVLFVLDAIDRTGRAPAGYRGGTTFLNDGRDGGEVLPRADASGRRVTYREWDVNPYTGANRGTERLVTGSDGSAWYTDDHYNTFVRVR